MRLYQGDQQQVVVVSWCFTPSQTVRLYQGDQQQVNGKHHSQCSRTPQLHTVSFFQFKKKIVSMSLTHEHVLSVWKYFVHSINHPYNLHNITLHLSARNGLRVLHLISHNYPHTLHPETGKLSKALVVLNKVQGLKNDTLFLPNHQGAQGPCKGENLSLYLLFFLTAALVTVVMTFTITLTFVAAGGALLAAGVTAAALDLAAIQSSLQLGPQGPFPGLKVSINTWGRTQQRQPSGSVLSGPLHFFFLFLRNEKRQQ